MQTSHLEDMLSYDLRRECPGAGVDKVQNGALDHFSFDLAEHSQSNAFPFILMHGCVIQIWTYLGRGWLGVIAIDLSLPKVLVDTGHGKLK